MGLRRAGLDRIERADGELRIGATTTLTQPGSSRTTSRCCAEAASRTASWSIRNMGTVGGNLFTPPPGGDVAVALLALDARVVVTGPAGRADPAAGRLLDRLPDRPTWPPTSWSTSIVVPLRARAGRRSSSSAASRPTRRPS